MKSITIGKLQVLYITIAWMVVFGVLEIISFNKYEILSIVGFFTLALLPGFLTILSFRLKNLPVWAYIGFAIGFSLLELMSMALVGNTILPFFGILRPLDSPYIFLELYLLIDGLCLVAWLRMESITLTIRKYFFFSRAQDTLFAFTPIIFVILSILGAIHLNDGGSGIITMIMLACIAIYACFLISYVYTLQADVIPTALFFIALSLLLMTSLRGWYVTGHDIQRESEVFELAKTTGIWSMAAFRDAYNACLSITILPTILANILPVADQYIFKIFFQIFFAFCPVLVYLIGNQWTSRKIALFGSIYFIAFPTYFTDMPFINRQEIAFVYFGLMLYIIFEKNLSLQLRRLLFMIMGVGVILSHYSTTYIILILFGAATLSRPFFLKVLTFLKNKSILKTTPLDANSYAVISKSKITIGMVGILLVLSFCWTTIITQTSNSVTSVAVQTFSAVAQGFGSDNRSIDATSLLSFSNPNPNIELQEYINTVVQPIRAAGSPGEYFPESVYGKYPIVGLPTESLPISALGNFLDIHHINITELMPYVGQLFAKSAELFLPLGLIYITFRKKIIAYVDDELYIIALYSFIFIGLNIILPVLSVQYGIFRAIQQSMFVIAPILVVGSILFGYAIYWIINKILKIFLKQNQLDFSTNIHKWGIGFASVFVIGFFLYSSGFIPQLFGNNAALLHLNNSGEYYDDFLTHAQEVYSITWLSALIQSDPSLANKLQFDVESDRFSSSKLSSVADLSSSNDILPEIVRTNAYVYLSYANVTKQRASELFDGNRIPYQYPIQFLDENKDLIYNNGGSHIYH